MADFIKKASLTNPQIVGLDQPKDQAEYEDVSNHSFTNTLMLNKAEKPLNTIGRRCDETHGVCHRNGGTESNSKVNLFLARSRAVICRSDLVGFIAQRFPSSCPLNGKVKFFTPFSVCPMGNGVQIKGVKN